MSAPVLAPATDEALIWVMLDSHSYALCHMTQTPRLDGFGPRYLEPIALYEYDPFAGQWLSCPLTPSLPPGLPDALLSLS